MGSERLLQVIAALALVTAVLSGLASYWAHSAYTSAEIAAALARAADQQAFEAADLAKKALEAAQYNSVQLSDLNCR